MRIAPIQRMRNAVARDFGFGFASGFIANLLYDAPWVSKRRAPVAA
jgi:hypothetical protein